jgi:hypothetical protein
VKWTTQQSRAIRYPCFNPDDPRQQKFGWWADPVTTLRLTINVESETGKPYWHASVVIWLPLTHTPVLVANWTDDNIIQADSLALATLLGVGIHDRTVRGTTEIGVHFRRETTEQERDLVFKSQRGWEASRKQG